MRRLIRRCAELHVDHIAGGGDPFERGSARPLDFGHWSAHKLEQLTQYQLSHGEAVAVGIALDTLYSKRCGLLPARCRGSGAHTASAARLPIGRRGVARCATSPAISDC